MKKFLCISALLLAGCAGTGSGPASVERMYVIECGENHVKDLSRWTPGVNVGRSHVFGDHSGNANAVKLNGDHDVFGDGSVTIKSAPGHTPGHQVLLVRLPKRGPVILSGDMVHLVYSWNNRVVPSFNFDVALSGRTIDAMKQYAAKTGAQLWITHDKEQHASIPKAPAYVE